MRKESVYALIYARMKVGDAVMDPYINQLPSSKVSVSRESSIVANLPN